MNEEILKTLKSIEKKLEEILDFCRRAENDYSSDPSYLEKIAREKLPV